MIGRQHGQSNKTKRPMQRDRDDNAESNDDTEDWRQNDQSDGTETITRSRTIIIKTILNFDKFIF